MTREIWTDEDELNFKMGDMHGEVPQHLSMGQKIAMDMIWEAQHPELRGWAKTKAFMERVKDKGPKPPKGGSKPKISIRKPEVEKKHIKRSGK